MILEETASMRAPRKRSLSSYIFEDADPAKVDLPTNLSDIAKDAEKMKARISSGADSVDKGAGDDVISSTVGGIAVTELKPSQSTMDVKKAVEFGFSALLKAKPMTGGPRGEVGAVISPDTHIMDGHHRWIASLMVDPASEMVGPKVTFPASKLIPVLNLVTVGKYDRKTGNPGSGAFADFTADKMKPIVLNILEKGYWAESDPSKCKEAAVKFVGADANIGNDELAKKVAEKFASNINSSSNWNKLPDGAPPRDQMPVINAPEVDDVVKALAAGEVDVNPPYGKNESASRKGDFVMERWHKMAGLIKG